MAKNIPLYETTEVFLKVKNKLEFSQISLSLRQQWKCSTYNSLWNPRLLESERMRTTEGFGETHEFSYLFLNSITIVATIFIWELTVINPGSSYNFSVFWMTMTDFKQMYIYPR